MTFLHFLLWSDLAKGQTSRYLSTLLYFHRSAESKDCWSSDSLLLRSIPHRRNLRPNYKHDTQLLLRTAEKDNAHLFFSISWLAVPRYCGSPSKSPLSCSSGEQRDKLNPFQRAEDRSNRVAAAAALFAFGAAEELGTWKYFPPSTVLKYQWGILNPLSPQLQVNTYGINKFGPGRFLQRLWETSKSVWHWFRYIQQRLVWKITTTFSQQKF